MRSMDKFAKSVGNYYGRKDVEIAVKLAIQQEFDVEDETEEEE